MMELTKSRTSEMTHVLVNNNFKQLKKQPFKQVQGKRTGKDKSVTEK